MIVSFHAPSFQMKDLYYRFQSVYNHLLINYWMGCKQSDICHVTPHQSVEIHDSRNSAQLRHDLDIFNNSQIINAQITTQKILPQSLSIISRKENFSSDSLLITNNTESDELYFLKNIVTKQLFQKFLNSRPSRADYELKLTNMSQEVVEIKPGLLFLGQYNRQEQQTIGILINENYIYEGQLLNMQFQGEGYLFTRETIYYGQFIEGNFEGKGSFKRFDGYQYVGQFKNGLRFGHGTEQYPDGSIRKGMFYDDQLYGLDCEIHYSNQSIYEGGVKKNLKHGFGKMTWRDGKVYEGEWKDDMMDGRGILVYPDGKKYHGGFLEGLKEGRGIFTWADGTQYVGGFHQGRQSGIGTIIDKNGISQDFWWEDGRKLQRCNSLTQVNVDRQVEF